MYGSQFSASFSSCAKNRCNRPSICLSWSELLGVGGLEPILGIIGHMARRPPGGNIAGYKHAHTSTQAHPHTNGNLLVPVNLTACLSTAGGYPCQHGNTIYMFMREVMIHSSIHTSIFSATVQFIPRFFFTYCFLFFGRGVNRKKLRRNSGSY